jgi:hypothetical protein
MSDTLVLASIGLGAPVRAAYRRIYLRDGTAS